MSRCQRITSGVTVAIVATVLAGLWSDWAGATTVHVQTRKVSGIVNSVNGTSTPGTCGTSGSSGQFAVTSKGSRYTVDVGSTSTTFVEKGVSAPSFADLCAGDLVRTIDTVSANGILAAIKVTVVPPPVQKVSGTVTSVNGTNISGACGSAGAAGSFTVLSKHGSYTVEVGSTSTTFKEHGVSSPSFADVCTGDKVHTRGPISSDDVVAAVGVTVVPPRPHGVSGLVASVNGTSTAGTCGSAATTGDFTLRTKRATYTVDVGSTSTIFKEHGISSPSFADVCTGDRTRVVGTVSSDLVSATHVTVIPPRHHSISGTVASVNGVTMSGACGNAGTTGDFTLRSKRATYNVKVAARSTTFEEKGRSAPSFADVCTGDKARVLGAVSSDDVVSATHVTVIPPHPQKVSGTVAAVNGTSTCGAKGAAGNFTLRSKSATYTVDVGSTSTTFKEHGISAPSFASICPGDKVKTTGTVSPSDNISATAVVVTPPPK